jgi:hypothetical protein
MRLMTRMALLAAKPVDPERDRGVRGDAAERGVRQPDGQEVFQLALLRCRSRGNSRGSHPFWMR